MTRRDDAIKAAGLALHCDACTNDGHDGCDTSDWDREAETALDAALAVLQPVVPNTAEALDALPVGTVLRNNEETVAQLMSLDTWHLTDDDDSYTTDRLVKWRHRHPWTVLWWGDKEPA